MSSAEPFTDARELAERLAQWSHEGITALGFALKLAGIDRDLLRAADEICRREIIPRLAEQDVDEFYHKNGRYMSDNERAAELEEGMAKPRRSFTPDDQARLKAIVHEVAAGARDEFPGIAPEEGEQIVYARLRRIADVL